MSGMVTIKTLADETGFSNETVSHILTGRARQYRHSRETEKKVLAAARRRGYMPNGMARAYRKGSFGTIGLIHCCSPGRGYVPDSLMDGIQEEITQRGFHLMLSWVPEELLQEKKIPKMLTELMVDGFLMDYLYPSRSPVMSLIRKSRTPTMILNSEIGTNCFSPDDYKAGADAANYLIALGHREIYFVNICTNTEAWTTPSNHYSERYRYRGYSDALIKAGLEPKLILGDTYEKWGGKNNSDHRGRIMPWLSSKDRPTAIVFNSPEIFFSTIFRYADVAGLRIPDDLSLITFSSSPCIFDDVRITTMVEPFFDIGRAAVAALIDKIKNKTGDLQAVKFPFRFEQGESCTRARERGRKHL